jgi:hypothetical protein
MPRQERSRRPPHRMPLFMRQAIEEFGLAAAYLARPPHQQNEYISWVTGARKEETRRGRLARVLDELSSGERRTNVASRSGPTPDCLIERSGSAFSKERR